MTQLIIHGSNWTIKRQGVHHTMINYLDLIIDLADKNGDMVIIDDRSDKDLIIIKYERRHNNGK